MNKQKETKNMPFGGVYIFAKNIKNNGQILSEGENTVTHIETDRYSGRGKISAKSTGFAKKKEKLIHNPFFHNWSSGSVNSIRFYTLVATNYPKN